LNFEALLKKGESRVRSLANYDFSDILLDEDCSILLAVQEKLKVHFLGEVSIVLYNPKPVRNHKKNFERYKLVLLDVVTFL
jgi:hypothetical protein